jgi:AcrR family transcriptional regulator
MRASKRQQVVDTASARFSKHGFHPVGVDWIVDESGVARMTLYRHFASKDELIREVLEQRYTLIMGSVVQALAPQPDAAARLKRIFDWYEAWFRSPAFSGCLFERALAEFGPTNPSVTDVAVRYRDDLLGLIESLLKDAVPPDTARWLAGVCVMLLSGATADARAVGDPSAAGRAWEAAQALLEQATAAAAVA